MNIIQKIAGNSPVARPDAISVLCILLSIWAGIKILQASLGLLGAPGILSFLGLLMSLGILISLAGLWRMQRWGVHLFLGIIALNIALVQAGSDNLNAGNSIRLGATFLMAVIYLLVVMPHWSKLVTKKQPGQDKT